MMGIYIVEDDDTMIEILEDDDDVQKVYTNCTIDLYE